jgi:hypothetical protein
MVNAGVKGHTGVVSTRPARAEPAAAPDRLALVQSFLNTLHVEKGTDALADVPSARAWLARTDLPASSLTGLLTTVDVDRLVGLRAVLRDLCGDGAPDPALFAEVAGAAALRPALDATGRLVLVPAGTDGDAVVAEIVTIVLEAQRDGTWDRLRICRNNSCRWVFYDLSRSRTGTWCAMGICGNRTKVAAYRRRHVTSQ